MQINDFSKPLTSKSLNESLAKQFGCNINLAEFTDGQLQDARNKLRTKLSQFEVSESFDGITSNHEYQKTRMFLDVINQEIFEREMSPSEISKENQIKQKVDKSSMKKDMQKQYGKEKGKEVYFATIRKRAMSESVPESWIESAISRITLGECDTDELKSELKVRYDLSESQASWMLCENEETRAEIIMATKDMVDRVTGWIEDTAAMQAEQLLELIDSIKMELGSDTAEQYSSIVRQSLGSLYTTLEDSRKLLTQGLDIVSGNQVETMGDASHDNEPLATGGVTLEPAAAPEPSDVEPESPEPPEEFPATPSVASRMKRESIDYRAKLNKLLETSKKK